MQRDGLVDQQRINHERVQVLSRGVNALKKSLLAAGTLVERESLQLELEERKGARLRNYVERSYLIKSPT